MEIFEVFLNNDNNINEVVKELNVYMNIFSYWLKWILEIGDINLKDVN